MRRHIFTPTTLQLVRELANEGKSAAEIAALIGSTPASVRVKCSQRKIRLGRRGRPSAQRTGADRSGAKKLLIRMRPVHLAAFKRKAALLGKTPTELAAMLLEAIVTSDIYEAVLGDR